MPDDGFMPMDAVLNWEITGTGWTGSTGSNQDLGFSTSGDYLVGDQPITLDPVASGKTISWNVTFNGVTMLQNASVSCSSQGSYLVP